MLAGYEIAGAATALGLGSYALYGTFAPTSGVWGRVIWRAPKSRRPCVSLTFDDGPTEGCTDRILDLLGEHDVHAAFFVIGRNAARWPDLVRRMDAEGHLVANHSFDHGHFDMFRGWRFWNSQMVRSCDLIGQIIGKRPAIFRPPMGFTTPFIQYSAWRADQKVVTWSRRGIDGKGAELNDILNRMLRKTGPGDILMLHDGIDPHLRPMVDCDRSATIAAVPQLIETLRKRDLSFVRLDELLGLPGYAVSESDGLAPAANVTR